MAVEYSSHLVLYAYHKITKLWQVAALALGPFFVTQQNKINTVFSIILNVTT